MRSNGTARATDAREDVERYVGARIVGILDSLEVVAELERRSTRSPARDAATRSGWGP